MKSSKPFIFLLILMTFILISSVYFLNFVDYDSRYSSKTDLEKISGPVCYFYDGTLSNGTVPQNSSLPIYEEQESLIFDQDFGRVLQYNVSAVFQLNSYGNGPTYLLDGETNSAYWYQVGLGVRPAYENLQSSNKKSGFLFIFEVWNVSSGKSIYPTYKGAGGVNFSGPVDQGDTILLSLEIVSEPKAAVIMSGYDWDTRAFAIENYSTFSATHFISSTSSSYPTGLMTEWYVPSLSFCGDKKVEYSNSLVNLQSADMCIDWMEYPNYSIITAYCTGVFSFPNDLSFSRFKSLSYAGQTIYSTQSQFVTG